MPKKSETVRTARLTVSFRIAKDLYAKVLELAAETENSRSRTIEHLLRFALEERVRREARKLSKTKR